MEIDITKQVNVNIRYKNESNFDLIIRITKDSTTAYTLTGKTLRMDIKEKRDDQSYVYRLTDSDGITISDTNLLTFSKVMTLKNDTYFYDLKIVTDSQFIMGGLIKVERNVT